MAIDIPEIPTRELESALNVIRKHTALGRDVKPYLVCAPKLPESPIYRPDEHIITVDTRHPFMVGYAVGLWGYDTTHRNTSQQRDMFLQLIKRGTIPRMIHDKFCVMEGIRQVAAFSVAHLCAEDFASESCECVRHRFPQPHRGILHAGGTNVYDSAHDLAERILYEYDRRKVFLGEVFGENPFEAHRFLRMSIDYDLINLDDD